MVNKRLLIQIRIPTNKIVDIDEEEREMEAQNPDSEYFIWNWASLPISELQQNTIIASQHSQDEAIIVDQLGQAMQVLMSVKELHNILNTHQDFTWN